jgi:hypothetical protein
MSVTIHLAPEIERRLREKAALNGQSLEDYLRRLAEESARPESSPGELPAEGSPRPLSAEEWVAEFRAWAASHPTRTTVADDSRESIYAGRGE